ncbi:MAG: sigma-70 family RNA polymerase sigma factor [Planctomycetota bacterium]
MTDTDALTRYARFADADAFAALVQRYESLVFGVCVRQLGRGADAEDATQLTFMKLARSAAGIQNRLEGTLGAWLHKTAARTAVDLGRQRGTRRRHEAEAARVREHRDASYADGSGDAVVEAAALAELTAEVDAALLELDEAQRALIVEVFFRGKTQRQVAKARGVCQARVCREQKAAVAALRLALSRRGVLVPAGGLLAGLTAVGDASAGLAVPAAASAGCVKLGLAGVGGGPSGATGGLGAPSSVGAWASFAGSPVAVGWGRAAVFWLLLGAAALGLGLAVSGLLGSWSEQVKISQVTQSPSSPTALRAE